MNQQLMSVAQKGFSDFLESTSQLQELLAQEITLIADPESKKALEEYLGLMRTTQARLQETYSGEVETMVQGFSDVLNSLSAVEQKKGGLIADLEGLQRKAGESLQQAVSTLAERARTPKPPSPADLARQRLAAMARRHGVEGQPNGILPSLRDGTLLQQKLLGILQPKPDPQVARAKAIGNIWENWPSAAAAELESEDR